MSEENLERVYREAAQAYLGAPSVEAAGSFRRDVGGGRLVGGDDDPAPFYILADFLRSLWGVASPWARLHGYFLLAVTRDKVLALNYAGTEKPVVTEVLAAFDRDEVWLRTDAGGAVIYFESRKHQVPMPGGLLQENRGAAEVMAALAKRPTQEAAGLSEYGEAISLYLGGEDVEAIGAFTRARKTSAHRTGFPRFLFYDLVRRSEDEKEGRLAAVPETFLLAVSEDTVHVFSTAIRPNENFAGEHIADFAREQISIATEMGMWGEVGVLELDENGRKSRLKVRGDVLNPKKNLAAAEVVAALSK